MTSHGRAALNAEVTRQAMVVAYANDFKLMMLVAVVALPLIFLLKREWRSRERRRSWSHPGGHQVKGSWRSGLPVSRAMALAKAGASGGRPGSPMPVGGSALGTMWTSKAGTSVMRATV